MIAVILVLYVIGIFIFLYALHRWSNFFELTDYDNIEDEDKYDDYSSNEEAYLSYAIAWPMYILVFFFVSIYRILLKISVYFKKITKNQKNIS